MEIQNLRIHEKAGEDYVVLYPETSVTQVLDLQSGKKLNEYLGSLLELKTANKGSIVISINELFDKIVDVVNDVGSLPELNTTNKDTLVDAINEVVRGGVNSIGDILQLTTKEKTTIVGAINEIVADMKRQFITPQHFGAVGDGQVDDSQALEQFDENSSIGVLPNGDYKLVTRPTTPLKPRMILASKDAKVSGKNVPLLSISSENFQTIPNNMLFIQQDTSKNNTESTIQIQRNVTSHDGYINPKALRVASTILTDTTQTEWAISGELYNYSNIASEGNTAVSGVSRKYGKGQVFAGHFQVKDHVKFATPNDVTPLTSVEFNACAIGKDHPTANYGLGNRFGMDMIAITTNDDDLNAPDGEIGVGMLIRTDDGNRTKGYFRYGLVLMDTVNTNPNPIGTSIMMLTHGQVGIDFRGDHSLADIKASGKAQFGVLLHGQYSSGIALRINANDALSFDGTGSVRQLFDGTDVKMKFRNGATDVFSIDMTDTPAINLKGVKVLGERKTGWGDMLGTATRSGFDTTSVTLPQLAQRVKALVEDLKSHGLIGQ